MERLAEAVLQYRAVRVSSTAPNARVAQSVERVITRLVKPLAANFFWSVKTRGCRFDSCPWLNVNDCLNHSKATRQKGRNGDSSERRASIYGSGEAVTQQPYKCEKWIFANSYFTIQAANRRFDSYLPFHGYRVDFSVQTAPYKVGSNGMRRTQQFVSKVFSLISGFLLRLAPPLRHRQHRM